MTSMAVRAPGRNRSDLPPAHQGATEVAACVRCGLERQIRPNRKTSDYCWSCTRVLALVPETDPVGLSGGRMVRDGLIWRFKPWQCPVCGEPLDSEDGTCTPCGTWARRDAVRASWRRGWWAA